MHISAFAKNYLDQRYESIQRKKMTDDFIMVAINNIDFN